VKRRGEVASPLTGDGKAAYTLADCHEAMLARKTMQALKRAPANRLISGLAG